MVWSEECLRHDPGGEVWLGVRDAGTEVPERALMLRDALAAAGAPVVPAVAHGEEVLRAVHDPALIDHLAGVWAAWEQAGFPAKWGRDRVVPYVFPTPGMLGDLPGRMPPAVHGRAGRFCYDTMTLVGPGSWAAIRAAADAALTAADLVELGGAAGLRAVPAAGPSRHPGRLRRLLLPQQRRDRRPGADRGRGRAGRRARHRRAPRERHPVDLLYRGDVCYGSVHIDPGAGWFPHYVGYADERGAGPGEGANQNLPLPPGTGDEGWLEAVRDMCAAAAAHRPGAVVVSLGVDAAETDPESPLRVTEAGYREAGRLTAALAPTVLVQEGGYDLPTLGPLVVAALTGAAEA